MLESGARGDSETKMFGDEGHRRDQEQGIGDRYLRRLADGGLIAGVVDVVGAEHIGDEQSVEAAALEELGQICPIGQVLVPPRLVVGVPPQAGGLVRNTIHIECVETDDAGHPLSIGTPTTSVTGCTRDETYKVAVSMTNRYRTSLATTRS